MKPNTGSLQEVVGLFSILYFTDIFDAENSRTMPNSTDNRKLCWSSVTLAIISKQNDPLPNKQMGKKHVKWGCKLSSALLC